MNLPIQIIQDLRRELAALTIQRYWRRHGWKIIFRNRSPGLKSIKFANLIQWTPEKLVVQVGTPNYYSPYRFHWTIYTYRG